MANTKNKKASTKRRIWVTTDDKLTKTVAGIVTKRGKKITAPALLDEMVNKFIKREKLTIN